MKDYSSLVNHLRASHSRKEVHSLLAEQPLEVSYKLLKNLITSLDFEVETEIIEGNTALAMWKMSQTVIFEDVLTSVEKLLIKSRVLSV